MLTSPVEPKYSLINRSTWDLPVPAARPAAGSMVTVSYTIGSACNTATDTNTPAAPVKNTLSRDWVTA